VTLRFWKNFGLIALNNVLTPLFAMALVLAISRLSGPELLGKYSLLMAVLVLGQSCASLGLHVIITREAACARDRAGRFFLAAALVGVSVMTVVLVFAVPLVWFWIDDPELRVALSLILLALVPSVLSGHAEALLLGLEESRPFVGIALMERLAATMLCTALVFSGRGIVAIAVVILLLRGLATAWLMAVLRRMHITFGPVDSQLCRRLLREVPVLASIPVANAFYSRLDVLLLSAFRGFAELGVYSAAARLVDVARVFPMAFSRAIYPVVSRLHTQDGRGLARTFQEANRALSLLMCCVALALAASAGWLIELLFGPSFHEAGSVLRVLAWSVVPFAVASLFAQVLFAANLAALDLRVNIISIVLCAGLNAVAIPRWGAVGAAAATLTSATVYACLQYIYVATRVTRPSLLGTFTRIGTAAGVAWAMAWFTLWLAWPPITALAVALIGYLIGLVCSGSLGRQDLVTAYALLSSLVPRRV